jgi:hypothetical protein
MEFNDPITQGILQTPYQEIAFTIPAGGRDRANIDFRYFRLITLSGSGLRCRFGQSGSFTSIVGAGIGIELPQAVSLAEFENSSGAAISFTIGVSMGRINDDRLNTVGSITISSSPSSPVYVKNTGSFLITVADASVPAGSLLSLITGNSIFRKVILSNPITSAGEVRIGGSSTSAPTATQGIILRAGETIELENSGTVQCFNPNAVAVNIARAIIQD